MTGRYCGQPGLSVSSLVRAILDGSGELPPWPQFTDRHTIVFARARDAIAASCALLGLRSGDEVLMPSYNCGTEIEAVRSAGVTVSLYRIDRGTRIDVEDLRSRVTARTRAVSVTHYFGWPQDLDEVLALCKSRGLLLLEDCALSLLSADGPAWLGLRGDAAAFSFPKTLAVPDGGALLIRTAPRGAADPETRCDMPRVARRCVGLLRRRVRRALGVRARPSAGSAGGEPTGSPPGRIDMPSDYYWESGAAPRRISGVTLGLMKHADFRAVVERRRRNYRTLLERIGDVPGVEPLFGELPEGVCPLECALLVADKNRWISALRARGIDAIPWWSGYHRDLPWDEFPDACFLKDHVLAVPINQDLDDRAMEHIARAAREISLSLS